MVIITNKEIQIMNEYKKLFIENEITSTSIDDIAKTCNISKSTFYKYFTTKENLICSILEYSQNSLLSKCKNIHSNFDIDSTEKLRQKILLILEYKYKNYDFRSYVVITIYNNKEYKISKLQKTIEL